MRPTGTAGGNNQPNGEGIRNGRQTEYLNGIVLMAGKFLDLIASINAPKLESAVPVVRGR